MRIILEVFALVLGRTSGPLIDHGGSRIVKWLQKLHITTSPIFMHDDWYYWVYRLAAAGVRAIYHC